MTRDQLRDYLTFYEDLGVTEVYRRKPAAKKQAVEAAASPMETVSAPHANAGLTSTRRTNLIVPDPIVIAPPAAPAIAMASATAILPPLAPSNDTLDKIRTDIGPDCRLCRLCEQRNKIVFGSGNEQARLVFVGEGPGADEDAQGLPFIGRAGQLLTQMIDGTASKEGVPIQRKDVYICNVVKCRPPENRAPMPDEMEMCGQFLFRQLMTIRPAAICALGSTAAKALLGTKEGVMKLRGKWHKWNDIPLMVTYHPSYLLRPYNQDAKRESWEDLKKILHFVYD